MMWVVFDFEVCVGRVFVYVCVGFISYVFGILVLVCEILLDLWLFIEFFFIGDKGEVYLLFKFLVDFV